jgi:hypothetical protein
VILSEAGEVLESGAELVMLDETAEAAKYAELDVKEEEVVVLLDGSSEEETADELAELVSAAAML